MNSDKVYGGLIIQAEGVQIQLFTGEGFTNEGWGYVLQQGGAGFRAYLPRRYHFFRKGDKKSLCGSIKFETGDRLIIPKDKFTGRDCGQCNYILSTYSDLNNFHRIDGT